MATTISIDKDKWHTGPTVGASGSIVITPDGVGEVKVTGSITLSGLDSAYFPQIGFRGKIK